MNTGTFSRGILLLTAVSGFAFGNADKVGNHNIGAGAGFITGYGLSYRRWFGRFGFQVTGAPYYVNNKHNRENTSSIGVTALMKITEAKFVNLIAYAGPHYFISEYRYKTNSDIYYDSDRAENVFFGAGPGLDFHFLNISLNLMFGYFFEARLAEHRYGTQFSGDCALYYSF